MKASMTLDLNVEFTAGHGSDFSCDDCLNAKISERASENSTRKNYILRSQLEEL
jgi:hypothetical protein